MLKTTISMFLVGSLLLIMACDSAKGDPTATAAAHQQQRRKELLRNGFCEELSQVGVALNKVNSEATIARNNQERYTIVRTQVRELDGSVWRALNGFPGYGHLGWIFEPAGIMTWLRPEGLPSNPEHEGKVVSSVIALSSRAQDFLEYTTGNSWTGDSSTFTRAWAPAYRAFLDATATLGTFPVPEGSQPHLAQGEKLSYDGRSAIVCEPYLGSPTPLGFIRIVPLICFTDSCRLRQTEATEVEHVAGFTFRK